MSLRSIQQQMSRNRGKTAVLGALTVVLVVVGVKSAIVMAPQRASAMLPGPRDGGQAAAPGTESGAETRKHTRESQMLWSVLREKRGLEADVAFRFDPSYYSL